MIFGILWNQIIYISKEKSICCQFTQTVWIRNNPANVSNRHFFTILLKTSTNPYLLRGLIKYYCSIKLVGGTFRAAGRSPKILTKFTGTRFRSLFTVFCCEQGYRRQQTQRWRFMTWEISYGLITLLGRSASTYIFDQIFSNTTTFAKDNPFLLKNIISIKNSEYSVWFQFIFIHIEVS